MNLYKIAIGVAIVCLLAALVLSFSGNAIAAGPMPTVSMFGIAFIIVIITAAGRESLESIGPALILVVLIHNLAGYTLGYWSGRLFKMSECDCRTIAIEVGMQNGGLASGLAKAMGKLATVGLAPAIFGPLMNITGSILASYWHRRPPVEKSHVAGAGISKELQIQKH